MLISVDPRSLAPLKQQIAAAVRRAIDAGELTAGERLPAAKTLAEELDVNIHTVLAAYQELRDAGLIELRRGRGATVLSADHARDLRQMAKELVDEARRRGLSNEDVSSIVRGL